MKRAKNITGSVLGKSIGIRFGQGVFDALKKHLCKDSEDEQFAFALFSQAKTADGTILIVRDLIIPDKKDLSEQSGGGVSPSRDFQGYVYMIAEQRKLSILDIHTHPLQVTPRFSPIDQAESAKNAECICQRFAYPLTHAMIVFGKGATEHDAVIYDRSLKSYRNVDRIEVLGRGIEVRYSSQHDHDFAHQEASFSRQLLIPGWDQEKLSQQKIVVVGAGGNGSQVLQTLVSIGAGSSGWIAAIDHDIIEQSNLPRIPYAYPEHIGQPKVTVAAQYAGRKNPSVRFYPYPCSVTEKAAIDRIKGATILIGAGDGDGLRQICNELSCRYLIPYVDLGCDIQVDGNEMESGGQVRVIIPGANACLVCCGGFDPAMASIELMDDRRAAVHAARGYVRGSRHEATPSVANLNAVISQLGIGVVLSLVFGPKFGSLDYIHYDQLSGQSLVAETQQREDCPVCGPMGILAAGDDPEIAEAREPQWSKMEAISDPA